MEKDSVDLTTITTSLQLVIAKDVFLSKLISSPHPTRHSLQQLFVMIMFAVGGLLNPLKL
jgi:hypothetical protein